MGQSCCENAPTECDREWTVRENMACGCAVRVVPRGWPGTGRRWDPGEDGREVATPIDTDQNTGGGIQ